MNTGCARLNRQFFVLDRAFKAGDRAAVEAALGNPPDFPNHPLPPALGIGDHPLDYAIYWSPLTFIIELIEAGADLNRPADDGFPSLMATLASDRIDRLALLSLLLSNGADPGQRGINDWTPLHYAVVQRDLPAVEVLLDSGADPTARSRIDDRTSPYEDAVDTGFTAAADLMRRRHPSLSRRP